MPHPEQLQKSVDALRNEREMAERKASRFQLDHGRNKDINFNQPKIDWATARKAAYPTYSQNAEPNYKLTRPNYNDVKSWDPYL